MPLDGVRVVTLMEAVVALVILSLVAIGCLELTQNSSSLEYSATQWSSAVTAAESRMAQVVSGAPTDALGTESSADALMRVGTRVTREPWRSGAVRGLEVISVSVPIAGGKQYVLRRVVAIPNAAMVGAVR